MSTEAQTLPEFERLEFNCENQVFHSDGYNAPPSAPKLDGDNRWNLIVVCAPATVLRLFRTRMEGGAARVGLLDYDSLRADFATFVQGNNWPGTPEGWAKWSWYQSILATANEMALPKAQAAPDPTRRYYGHIQLTTLDDEPLYLNVRHETAVFRQFLHDKRIVTAVSLTGGPMLYCRESVEDVMGLLYPPDHDEDDEPDDEPLQTRRLSLNFSEAADYMRAGYFVTRDGGGMLYSGVRILLTIGTDDSDNEVFLVKLGGMADAPLEARTHLASPDLLADDWYVVDPIHAASTQP